MKKAARGIAALVKRIDLILTSPLIRAHDTARIASRALRAEKKLEVCKALMPGGSVKTLLSSLSKYSGRKSIMVVGHEPDLGRFASSLLGSETSIIELKKGALCAIEVSGLPPHAKGKLLWHMQPRHLRALG